MANGISRRASALVGGALLLLPTAAHASGGWEGIGTLLGLLAVPFVVVVMILQAILLAVKKAQKVAGVITAVLGAMGLLWQLFWYALESGSEDRPMGFMFFGILLNVIEVVLAVVLVRSGKSQPKP